MLSRTALRSSRLLLSRTQQAQHPAVATRTFSSTAAAIIDSSNDEFMTNAASCNYSPLEQFLTHGGDDRSLIFTDTGTNKYHIAPRPIASDAIFRGSCTCNAPTERGYQAAAQLYENTISTSNDLDATLKEIFENQRDRIAKCLELPEGTEVVLCPSGSDAEYIPIVMARQLIQNPSRKMKNYVTQLKEIGAGSSVASGGLYFSTHAPLTGRLSEEEQNKGLKGFATPSLEEISIPARERSGSVIDGSQTITDMAAADQDSYTLLHGVFGGKTGLRDAVMPGSNDSTMGIIDACQGRFSLEELHGWLANDSVVLFTGSKFYQAPPFCGAVFIPPNMAAQLSQLPAPEPKEMFDSLSGFVTDKELSPCLVNSWGPLLKNSQRNNVGLALRWEAGLAGMEALSGTPDPQRVQAVEEWANQVTAMVQDESAYLDAWCIERSIISIRLKKGDDGWLNMDELRNVYRLMSLDLSSVPVNDSNNVLQYAVNLGQPVDVAESHAILRIALGSESLASYIQNPSATLAEDQTAVKKLAAVAKYYDEICQSGI